MMSDVDAQVARLNTVRDEIDKVKESRTRLTSQLETHKGQLDKLEKQAQDEFGVGLDELSDTIKKLQSDAENALKKAEKILGIEAETDE
jgi:chromosome segregation ATPase